MWSRNIKQSMDTISLSPIKQGSIYGQLALLVGGLL